MNGPVFYITSETSTLSSVRPLVDSHTRLSEPLQLKIFFHKTSATKNDIRRRNNISNSTLTSACLYQNLDRIIIILFVNMSKKSEMSLMPILSFILATSRMISLLG